MIEYSITIKDESTKLVQKGISYDPITLTRDNLFLQEEVEKALEKFNEEENTESPDIIIKTTMIW